MADGLEHLFGGTELERPKRDTGGAERHADAEHDCCCGCFGHATYSNKRAEQHGYREQDEETERPGERAELVTDDATTNFDTVKKMPASEMSNAATPASTPWVVSRMPK